MKNSLNPKIANWWGRHELVEDHCRISTPLTSPKMKSMKHKPRNTKNLHTCSMGPHPVFALIALRLLPPLTWALLSPCSMMLHFLPKTWTPCKPTLKFKPNHPNSPQWQESLINTWHSTSPPSKLTQQPHELHKAVGTLLSHYPFSPPLPTNISNRPCTTKSWKRTTSWTQTMSCHVMSCASPTTTSSD